MARRHLLLLVWIVAFVGFVSPYESRADFTWYNDASNLVYYADGITPLFGVKGSNSISALVQLIYAGPDGLIDVADIVNSTHGVSGDDQVVAWTYIGANLFGASGSTSHYGRVNGGTFTNEIPNGQYYARVWTAPSPDFVLGAVPTSFTNFYGNSELFTALAGFEPPAQPQDFDIGGANGIIANLVPVPEPSAFLLAILGLCTVRRWARRAN